MEIVIYEMEDLKEAIDRMVGNVTDINKFNFNDDQFAELVKITNSIVSSSNQLLVSKIPFAGSFGMKIRRFVELSLQAPMAVNITGSGLTTIMNLYVNPIWMTYITGDRSQGTFLENSTDVARVLHHEYKHLLFNHMKEYKNESEAGYHKIVNYATDADINQDPFIEESQVLTNYGITLKAIRDIAQNQSLKAKFGSFHYYTALFQKAKEQKEQSEMLKKLQKALNKMKSGQENSGQSGSDSQQDGQPGDGQNGSSQSGSNSQQDGQPGDGQNGSSQSGSNSQQDGQSGDGQSDSNSQQNGQSDQTSSETKEGYDDATDANDQSDKDINKSLDDIKDGIDKNNQNQINKGIDDLQKAIDKAKESNLNSDDSNRAFGGEGSHKVWNQTPENSKRDGEEIADSTNAENAIADAAREAMKQSGETADSIKGRGLMSGDILDAVISGMAVKGKLPYKSIIQKGAGRLKVGERRTYQRTHPHQSAHIDIIRGHRDENSKNIRVFVDNSGSMGTEEINFAVQEIAAVAKTAKARLEIIPFDAKVYLNSKQYVEKNGHFNYVPVGRGGTAFQPVFDYLRSVKAKNQTDLAIILTDGYGESDVNTYKFNNIIWTLVEQKSNTLSVDNPIGRVAWLEDDKKYKLHRMG